MIERFEFGYEILGAQQAGVVVTNNMRARMKELADESHGAEESDHPTETDS